MDENVEPSKDDVSAEKPLRYGFATLEEYLQAAESAADQQQLAQAIDILREAVRRFPESGEAYYDLGVALFMLLETRLAHLDLWQNLAEDEELAEEAVAAFEAAIERKPDFAPAYTNLGNMLALRGNVKKAVKLWRRSLELDPNQPEVAENLERYAQLVEDEATSGED